MTVSRHFSIPTLLAFLLSPLSAQTYGEITGTVSDTTGAVIEGASVNVRNTATSQVREVQTNQTGAYDVPFLVPGSYVVRVEKQGFKSATRSDVLLQVGAVARVDFTVDVGVVLQSALGRYSIVHVRQDHLGPNDAGDAVRLQVHLLVGGWKPRLPNSGDTVAMKEKMMVRSSRRDFLKTGVAASVLSGMSGAAAFPQTSKRSATDWVTLGKSNVRVTRLAFGTGTYSGRVQRELGQQEFTRLVRHAYDRGIRFFETAESYHGMPEMLSVALKGIPRDSYRLMTKYSTPASGDPAGKIDQFRKQLGTDYIDILLLHCVRPPSWAADYSSLRDGFSEAKGKKVILAYGASVHGLTALRTFPGNQWLEIAMIRMNHNGTRMDTAEVRDPDMPGNVDEVVAHTKQVHAQGMGVISMKLCGEGRFTRAEDRDAAMKFAMNLGSVDAVTIGFKSTAEIDEAIDRMSRVMNA